MLLLCAVLSDQLFDALLRGIETMAFIERLLARHADRHRFVPSHADRVRARLTLLAFAGR